MGMSNYLPSSRLIQPGVCTSSTRPSSPFEGQAIFETDTDRMLIWNGTAWVVPNSPTANPTGLELITPTGATNGTVGSTGTVTIGNTVSSVTVNGAFSSLYDNYRIVLTTNSGSTDAAFFLRLAGSSTAYYYSDLQNTFAGANGTEKAENTTGWRIGSNDGANGTFSIVDIMRPNLAQMSFMSFAGIYGDIGGAAWSGQGMHNVASSFTGFEIYPNAGTFTGGTIAVYGYRK